MLRVSQAARAAWGRRCQQYPCPGDTGFCLHHHGSLLAEGQGEVSHVVRALLMVAGFLIPWISPGCGWVPRSPVVPGQLAQCGFSPPVCRHKAGAGAWCRRQAEAHQQTPLECVCVAAPRSQAVLLSRQRYPGIQSRR